MQQTALKPAKSTGATGIAETLFRRTEKCLPQCQQFDSARVNGGICVGLGLVLVLDPGSGCFRVEHGGVISFYLGFEVVMKIESSPGFGVDQNGFGVDLGWSSSVTLAGAADVI